MATKLSLRGNPPDDPTKTVTILSLSSANDSLKDMTLNDREALLDAIQAVTSATITSATLTSSFAFDELSAKPGDPLDPNEIFQEEFADAAVTPTLQFSGTDGDAKTLIIGNVKYMADPENTENFATKVAAAAAKLAQISSRSGVTPTEAKITLSMKDEVWQASS